MRVAWILPCLVVAGGLVGVYIGGRNWDLATVILVGLGAVAVMTLVTLIGLVAAMSSRGPHERDAIR